MNNRTNTHQGMNVEHLFANSILDHPRALRAIMESIGIPPDEIPCEDPQVIGSGKRKTDVEISFESGRAAMRVSVKSFKAGYNHLERRPLKAFCERNQIRKADQKFLEGIWIRKSKNDGKGRLVYLEERDEIRKIIKRIEPGVSALLGNDHPQVFAAFNLEESKWSLYNMANQVVPLVRSDYISVTSRGGNIEIGDYIVIQRKGSRRGENGHHIHSLEHGSNHVQIKMRLKNFVNDVNPDAYYVL